ERVPPDPTQRRRPDLATAEAERVDRRGLELRAADTVLGREDAARGIGEAIDAGADVARAAGVGFPGRVPERVVRTELEISRRERRERVGDRLPVAAAGRGTPDAAVGAGRVDVPAAVGRQAGDATRDQTGTAARVRIVVAVVAVVGVVR